MTDIRYFLRWGSNRLKSPDPLSHGISVAEAEKLHAERQIYTAVILRNGSPSAVVTINDRFFGVDFLDPHGREYLNYAFREIEPERLFLEQATFRYYTGKSRSASEQELYSFRPDGIHTEKVSDFDRNTTMVSEPREVDVSGNWEIRPRFGAYDRLLRIER